MLLAIDTATRRIGLALYDGVEVLYESVWAGANRHTVALSPAIENALKENDCTVADLEAIALSVGPGSYTGLRIGSAVAKGLALSLHIPLIGVPTFDIIAAAQPIDLERALAVVISAGRGRLGVGWYQVESDAWQATGKTELLTPEELNEKIKSPTVVAGELDETVRTALARKRVNALLTSPAQSLRRPSFLAELAWQRWQAGETDEATEIAPFYLQTEQNIPQ